MDDGRSTMADRRWTMADRRWTMADRRWTIDDRRLARVDAQAGRNRHDRRHRRASNRCLGCDPELAGRRPASSAVRRERPPADHGLLARPCADGYLLLSQPRHFRHDQRELRW